MPRKVQAFALEGLVSVATVSCFSPSSLVLDIMAYAIPSWVWATSFIGLVSRMAWYLVTASWILPSLMSESASARAAASAAPVVLVLPEPVVVVLPCVVVEPATAVEAVVDTTGSSLGRSRTKATAAAAARSTTMMRMRGQRRRRAGAGAAVGIRGTPGPGAAAWG